MEVEPPPVPTDPDGSRNTSRQVASSRKRHVEHDESAIVSGKKSVLNPPQASVQTMYTHSSLAHVSREVSDPSVGTSTRVEVWTVHTSKQIHAHCYGRC
ncbi:unnamed protein product [Leptidea sinapis]|uniref:Uncharacterized protein n=1 Tax=Leptidea sinapis TaxID=189913 RepID=A0A5E4PLX2_9NEOP|nr:unnamed protein product [Leptidea sinapis]